MKKRGGKLVRDTKFYMSNRLDKDLDRIVGSFVEHAGSKELLARHEWNTLNTTFTMYHQQRGMLENNAHTCADHTVSAFQLHVRPIDHGKAKTRTEFGAKVGASEYEERGRMLLRHRQEDLLGGQHKSQTLGHGKIQDEDVLLCQERDETL